MEKQQSLLASSFVLPAMPTIFRRPDWVLLDKVAYLADRPNGTTARCVTPIGQAVEVSFWLSDPPGLSHLCVHCPGLERTDFTAEPTVVCSEKNIAVLQIFFSFGPKLHAADRGHREYFVYEADYQHPSLRPLPIPYPLALRQYEFGLLPGVGGFRIAVLRPQKLFSDDVYDLHIFSSKAWTWSTKQARLGPQSPRTKGRCLMHDKVIALRGDTLGFVDLWHGILCCRVIDESPDDLLLRYIPLPPLLDSNKSMVSSLSDIRDVACIDGVVKFIEIAHRKRLVLPGRSSDAPSHKPTILHDSDLLEPANSTTGAKDVCHYTYDGWNAVIWNRLTGSDYWLLDCEIDVSDVTVSNPKHLALLPDLSSSHSAKSTLNRNLRTSAPAFGMHNGDAVYLTCKVGTAWVLEINTRMKRLENLAPISAERAYYFGRTYHPCALSRHMNMAPRKRKERDDANNVPADPTILVHGLDPCLTEHQLRNIFAMFGELRGLNIHANQHYASVKFARRPCAEKAMRIMDGTQFGRKKMAISWEINGQNLQVPLPNAVQYNGDAGSYGPLPQSCSSYLPAQQY
ncbi:unnamed protein product [Urochloa decumbens]|uniref:RRM domain-containing protein n=1 Tax=Urochloa decumbens TaxID=240449 RepID=A0ABC8XLU3_9POAL